MTINFEFEQAGITYKEEHEEHQAWFLLLQKPDGQVAVDLQFAPDEWNACIQSRNSTGGWRVFLTTPLIEQLEHAKQCLLTGYNPACPEQTIEPVV